MRPISARICIALIAMLTSTASLASSTLFVITSKDHRLPDPEGVGSRIQVPVQLLETGGVDEISSSINDSLSWVSNYNEATIASEMDRFKAEATAAVQARKKELHSAYVAELQIGEISSRYDVKSLPAVLELDSAGNFRMSSQPATLASAIGEIQTQEWSAAPPKLEDKFAAQNRTLKGVTLRDSDAEDDTTEGGEGGEKPFSFGGPAEYSVLQSGFRWHVSGFI